MGVKQEECLKASGENVINKTKDKITVDAAYRIEIKERVINSSQSLVFCYDSYQRLNG